ncbi:DNA-directed RNA polymerase V subunit 1 [Dorcoceras hygrometricum]|uniref:DNA-directed RNA polymerase V subunit 1 n=1 Tax=Dorcoceras hygrometricum TaxID=472368 RepID=A0A2Z7BMA5_9LAMI|nr:DNA-directed RNA polymerase V subunit 1 [Dorcoceras hygrometricum]
MSLFDLQDVCIAIGSLATLDLPMVVDLIGIYGLKGPYSTLTTTGWFLQALSVIPRGSWGDVARRFTMIRWAALAAPPSLSHAAAAAAAAANFAGIRSGLVFRGESDHADLVRTSSAV